MRLACIRVCISSLMGETGEQLSNSSRETANMCLLRKVLGFFLLFVYSLWEIRVVFPLFLFIIFLLWGNISIFHPFHRSLLSSKIFKMCDNY